MGWIRSALFQAGMILSLVAFALLAPLTLPLSFKYRYGFLTRWGAVVLWWLRVTCGVRYRVEGAEHIPHTPTVVLAKHQSTWETIALQRVLPPQTWVLKRELLRLPFFGWALALLRPIAIDRAAGRRALAQLLEQGAERLKQGIWVIVFPEGTRTAPGTRGRYNIGGAMLAEKTGTPALPVAHNAGEFWPRNSFLKRPGVITVVIGPPIATAGRKAGEINAEAEAWIEETMARISQATAVPATAAS